MLEQLEKLQKEKDKAYEAFREEYDKVCKQFEEALLAEIPYMNKIIKVKADVPKYIKVRDIYKSKNTIILKGYGFWSEFTSYADSTFANWDFMMEHEMFFSDIEEELKDIVEITEVEFNNAFDAMINGMKAKHINTLL